MRKLSISKTQISVKEEAVVKELLQKGIDPNSYEVTNKLKGYFDSTVPGLPYFKPIKAIPHETSEPGAYNQMFTNLGLDLDVVYRANLDQTKKVLMTEEYYLAEKEGIQTALDKLQLRMDGIQDALQSGKVSQSHCQVFDNFYNIEFDEDTQRNIPATTAFVDLVQRKVYSEKSSQSFDKYDISQAEVSVEPVSDHISVESSNNIEVALKDTLNEFYTFIVNSDNDKGLAINVTVTLPEVKDISCVSIDFTSSKIVNGSLSISEDGIYYTELYEISSATGLEWNFINTPVKHIRITLRKKEPDGLTSKAFQYYFIIKNISIVNEKFENGGLYVSKPIEFNDVIDTVTLKANDMIFPDTHIYYYIGLDNGVNKVDWQAIENDVPYSLGLLNDTIKVVNNIEPGFGAPVETSVLSGITATPTSFLLGIDTQESVIINAHYSKPTPSLLSNLTASPSSLTVVKGMTETTSIDAHFVTPSNDLYRVCQLPSNVNANSIEITPGYQMWYVEGTDILETDFQLIKFDYDSRKVDLKTFLDNEQYVISAVPNRVYVLTQYVFCEDEVLVDNTWLRTVALDKAQYLQSLMVINGNEIKSVSGTFSFKLKKGRNKVLLLFYLGGSAGGGNVDIAHNFNFKKYSFNVFSDPAMKIASIYTLQHKLDVGDRRFFGIDKDNFIVVKHDPLWESISEDCEGIRYLLKYKSLKPNSSDLLTVTDGIPRVQFRLMATLMSTVEDLSPQILSYRLIGQ